VALAADHSSGAKLSAARPGSCDKVELLGYPGLSAPDGRPDIAPEIVQKPKGHLMSRIPIQEWDWPPRHRRFYRTIDVYQPSGWSSPGVKKAVSIYSRTMVTIVKMLLAVPLSIVAIGAFWLLWIIMLVALAAGTANALDYDCSPLTGGCTPRASLPSARFDSPATIYYPPSPRSTCPLDGPGAWTCDRDRGRCGGIGATSDDPGISEPRLCGPGPLGGPARRLGGF
jgi:hypothetical protein